MKHKSASKLQVAPSCGQICNYSKWCQVMVKQTLSFVHWNEVQIWWKEILEIRKCWFEWNTNLFSRNSANLKRRNIWTAQSKFNAHREQTLLTCFLILVSSWRGRMCSCTPMTPRSGTSSTLLSQNDFIHHQADIQNGEDCVLIKKDMCSPTSPSWFWTSTSSIPTRQLASPSSMTRRLTTVWWREVLHHLRPCGHQHPTTCAPFPSNHHITS